MAKVGSLNSKALFCLTIFMVLLLWQGAGSAEIKVTTHWGSPEYAEPYTPGNKPPDMAEEDLADAQPRIRPAKLTGTSASFSDPNYQFSDIKINVTGYTYIREPNNCDPNLHAHELGHEELNRYEWNKNAKKKIEEELKDLDKEIFKGEGSSAKARKKDARNKAYAELQARLDLAYKKIFEQMKVLNEYYDKVTDHNRNGVSAADGVKETKERFDNVSPEEYKNIKPRETSKAKPGIGFGGIFSDPCSPFGTTFWPPIPLSDVNDSGVTDDTIEYRGLVDIDGFMTIGKSDNGIIELTDTALRITDSLDPCTVFLRAYIVNPQYRTSNNPMFASMIQGSLLIPLAPAECVNNVIASVWLDNIQQAAEANEYLSFWFYAEEELYDEDGNWIHGSGGVVGQLTLGIGMEVFDEIDRLDDYDNMTFLSEWHIEGGGLIELNESYAHNSNKSIQLIVDTAAPPHYSSAVKFFTPFADWSGPDKKSLEVWIDSDELSPEAQDYIYIRVEDSFGHTYLYKPAEPQLFENIWVDQDDAQWIGVNIDLRNLQNAGLLLHSIASISIGVEDPMMQGFTGMIYIDDISIRDTRNLGDSKFDFNADGVVNLADFALFAESWLVDENWPY
ncbi:MAG: hypothetical protein WDA68_07950 [Phycisphaerae bacterium]